MKKVLLFLGVVTLFFASCSEHDVKVDNNHSNVMTFRNLNGRLTRANSGANSQGDDYKIYASSSLSASKWYIDDTVVGDPSSSDFNSAQNGPYYWLNYVIFDFYAYAPASILATGTPNNLSIDYTVKPNADEDFTVATPHWGIQYIHTSAGVVNLLFHHVLTKININVDLHQDLKDAGYTIEPDYKADLNVLYSHGTVGLNNNLDPRVRAKTWNSLSTPATYSNNKSYMIIPQSSFISSSNGCSIQLKNIVIKKNGIKIFPVSTSSGILAPYDIKQGDILSDNFQMGNIYNLNFTINDLSTDKDGDLIFGQQIKFSATHADWNSVDVNLTQN